MRVNVSVAVENSFSAYSGLGFVESASYKVHQAQVTEKYPNPEKKLVLEFVIAELNVEQQATGEHHTLRWGCGGKALESDTADGTTYPFRMCPGTSADRHSDPEPLGTEVGVEGNCLFSSAERYGLNAKSGAFVLGQSLAKAGLSAEAVAALQADEFVGMVAEFATERVEFEKKDKAEAGKDSGYTASVVTRILEAPNVPDFQGRAKAVAAKPAVAVKATLAKPSVLGAKAGVLGKPVAAAKPVVSTQVAAQVATVTAPEAGISDADVAIFVEVLGNAMAAGKFASGTHYDQAALKAILAGVVMTSIPGPKKVQYSKSCNTLIMNSWADLCGNIGGMTDSALMFDESVNAILAM